MPLASAAIVMSCLASCQAVFTYSPLSFLQRDPAALSVDQQVQYAREALQSGDGEALVAVYDALAAAAAAAPEDGALQYTAAQVALELSGVGDVFAGLLDTLAAGGGGDIDPFAVSEELLAALDLDLLADAGAFLLAADDAENPADLTASDYLVGAVGLLLAPAADLGATTGEQIIETLDDNPNLDAATDFLEAAVAELPADDPAAAILQALLDALSAGGGGA